MTDLYTIDIHESLNLWFVDNPVCITIYDIMMLVLKACNM